MKTSAIPRRILTALALAALTALCVLAPTVHAAGDASAELVNMVAPEYPDAAYSRRLEGWVELEFVVDTSGSVKHVSVISSEPARIFDAAAVRAVKKWEFKPATRGGQPVDSQERKRLVFKM